MKTHKLEAGQFVEFILTRERNETYNDDVNCGNTNSNKAMIVAVVIALRQSYLHLNIVISITFAPAQKKMT